MIVRPGHLCDYFFSLKLKINSWLITNTVVWGLSGLSEVKPELWATQSLSDSSGSGWLSRALSPSLHITNSEAIGSVLWPVIISRPDAVFAVGILSQFIQNPRPAQWEALKWVISYLGSLKNYWLTFGGKEKGKIQGFCDADWASQQHRHLISGFSFHFRQGAVSWSSKKQAVVALLSTEVEYIAQTHAAKEAVWIRNFVTEVQGTTHGPWTSYHAMWQSRCHCPIKGQ